MKQKTKTTKLSRVKEWYQQYRLLLLPLLIISIAGVIFLLSLLVHKHTVMKRDRARFNATEAVLRQLKFPEAMSTVYEKSCVFRSSKDLVQKNPLCRVSRVDEYRDRENIKLLDELYGVLLSQGGEENDGFKQNLNTRRYSEDESVVRMPDLSEDMRCSSGLLPNSEPEMFKLITTCTSQVKYQLYQESY